MRKNGAAAAKALKAFDRACAWAGNQTALAQHLGMSQQGVSKIRRGLAKGNLRALSGEHAKTLEDALDGVVTRLQLRPDIFG